MLVFIVEDDTSLSYFLNRRFSGDGHQVYCLESWDEFESMHVSNSALVPDLILLDRMLGQQDVTTQIPKIKNIYPQAGLLVMSAMGAAKERVAILDQGADDFLSKPFDSEELLSRARAIIRRQTKKDVQSFPFFGNVTVNTSLQDLTVNNRGLNTCRKEYLLGKLLIEHPNRVYNKVQLLDLVWDLHSDVESNVVEVSINSLRRKLEKAGATFIIKSRRNFGYWVEFVTETKTND